MIDASAAIQGNGGRIEIDAGTLVGVGAVSTLLKTDGAGSGNGGIVNVSFAGSGGTANVEVLARGGTGGGNGGQVSWTARNGDLSINPHSWNVSVRGPQGDGGKISLQATNGQILLADGNLIANGKGGGVGGTITMRTISSGDIVLPNSTRLVANGGQGGQITIDSAGSLTTGAGGLVANSTTEGDGGTITLTAVDLITISGTMQANGRGAGNGGTITVNSQATDGGGGGGDDGGGGGVIIGLAAFTALEDPDSSVSVSLERSIQAKAGTTGNGGVITITNTASSIQFISSEPQQSINADGGTSSGDGGKVTLTSSSDLTLNATTISASARADGNGGNIELASVGKLTVNCDLRANGAGTGNGGSIEVTSGIPAPGGGGNGGGGGDDGGGEVIGFTLLATQPIQLETTGRIAADAGASGSGGRVTVKALTGSVSINDSVEHNQVTTRGGSSYGRGGEINITADGALFVGAENIDVSSRGAGDAGVLRLTALEGPITLESSLRADGGELGNGGSVIIESTGLLIGNSDAKLLARGGLTGGNGGSISIQAVDGIDLGIGNLTTVSRGGLGNGGTVDLQSSGDVSLRVEGAIDVSSHAQEGQGGQMEVSTSGTIDLAVARVQADSYGKGYAGSIQLNSENESISTTATLSAAQKGNEGDGGRISVMAPNGGIYVGGAVHADALGNGNGGTIAFDAPGGHEIQGVTTAKGIFGGTLSHWNTSFIKSLDIDMSGGQSGGYVFLGARGNILVTGSVNTSSVSGPAGIIHIQANQNGTGTDAFVVGKTGGNNGVTGDLTNVGNGVLSASPRAEFGNACITIEDLGHGGIQIEDNSIHATISNILNVPVGQMIVVNSPIASITINGRLSANSPVTGCCPSGIVLLANHVVFGPGAEITASSKTNGYAGGIYISTLELTVLSDAKISSVGRHHFPPFGPSELPYPSQGEIRIVGQKGIVAEVSTIQLDSEITALTTRLIVQDPGDLHINGPGTLTIKATGPNSGKVNLLGNRISIDAPLELKTYAAESHSVVNATQKLSVDVTGTISQSDSKHQLKSPNGVVSVKTGSIVSLGEIDHPFTVSSKTLSFNTQSSAVVHNARTINTTFLKRTVVRGDFVFSTENRLESGEDPLQDVLLVQRVAQISADGNIGTNASPFRVAGLDQNVPLSIALHAVGEKNGNVNVEVETGPVNLLASSATKNFKIAAAGPIRLTGTISAPGGAVILQSSNDIKLSQGSSISSLGNIYVLAGADGSNLESPPRGTTPISIIGDGKVLSLKDWSGLSVTGSNVIEVHEGNQVRLVTGRSSSAKIFLEGTNLKSGIASNTSNNEEDMMVPVAFMSCVGSGAQSSPGVAHIGAATFYGDSSVRLGKAKGNTTQLESGRALVECRSPMTITLGSAKVIVKGKAILLLERTTDGVAITDLHDDAANNITISDNQGTLSLYPGQQLCIGSVDNRVASRNVKRWANLFRHSASLQEVSLPHLMVDDILLKALSVMSKKGFAKVLRNAAILQLLQNSHGAFRDEHS